MDFDILILLMRAGSQLAISTSDPVRSTALYHPWMSRSNVTMGKKKVPRNQIWPTKDLLSTSEVQISTNNFREFTAILEYVRRPAEGVVRSLHDGA